MAGGIALLGFFVVLFTLPNKVIEKRGATDPGKFIGPNYATLLYAFLKPLPLTAFVSMMGNYLLKVRCEGRRHEPESETARE